MEKGKRRNSPGETRFLQPAVRRLIWMRNPKGLHFRMRDGVSPGSMTIVLYYESRKRELKRKEKDEVNKREVHECDGRVRDPDVMVVPPTPKLTYQAEALVRASSTIVSSCEENAALKKWHLPRLCCAS
jgi:hypothetical protein